MISIKAINKNTVRFYSDQHRESMLTRYNILKEKITATGTWSNNIYSFGNTKIIKNENEYIFNDGNKKIRFILEEKNLGYKITICINDKERIFGLGDCQRESLMIRGITKTLHVTNVTSYGPMPYIMSSDGWGFLLNTTYDSYFDIDSENNNEIKIITKKGRLDFFFFSAETMKDVLGAYTEVSGKPMMMPAFAYGLTFVENEQMDTRGLLWTCKAIRDSGISCDTIGLEPNWMTTIYDFSTNKSWSRERYLVPSFLEPGNSGTCTFFYTLRQLGFKMSLWLCNDYDLFYKEENEQITEENDYDKSQAEFIDPHFSSKVMLDKVTVQGEAWFEHLKKFVDNGASCFKLDGANQVLEHPDRLWACKFKDEEAHNAYPIVLAKQMSDGFTEHTDRRAFIYSAGAYVGIQQYEATWAGDTGGRENTVLSVLNYAMCGHTNASVDMEISDPAALHYGFLLTWAQFLTWAQWRQPWFMKKECEDMFREYSNLRSSLFPYIYSMAHKAAVTGIPVVRPLALEFEETDEYDNVKNLYMLGDNILVGVFNMHFKLPQGVWVDYFTNKEYSGEIDYEIPKGKGGALFVRKGTVIVTMKPQAFIMEKDHEHIINVFPGEESEFTLYEDDMYTYDYLSGGYAETKIQASGVDNNKFLLKINKRNGFYNGRPYNGYNDAENSIPQIKGIENVRNMTVKINGYNILNVTLNGEKVFYHNNSFIIDAQLHENKDLSYIVCISK